MPFFLLAQTAPLFLQARLACLAFRSSQPILLPQVWWEKDLLAAVLRILKQRLGSSLRRPHLALLSRNHLRIFTLAPLHFIFQACSLQSLPESLEAKVIGYNITREITLGGQYDAWVFGFMQVPSIRRLDDNCLPIGLHSLAAAWQPTL